MQQPKAHKRMKRFVARRATTSMSRPPIQETIAVDIVVDKLLKARVPVKDIIANVNTCISSKRKLDETYINDRLIKIAKYQTQLGKLLRVPKVEQRSEEWHQMRKGLVTASEWAQSLGAAKFGTQKDFFKKKSGYETMPFNPGEAPLKWGTMYEDVAVEIYKGRYGYQMHEFGLIPHPSIKHFGASPDGINDFGVMVEIKCPYRRKITGEVPQQYYYQIQGQLSVCELDECDFVECELDEYGDLETWLEVGHEEKGIVIERKTEDPLNPWVYQYSNVMMTATTPESTEALRKQAQHFLDKSIGEEEKDQVVLHFWTLRVFNCVRVYRNNDFITDRFMELEPIWNKILTYRDNYELYKTEITPPRKNSKAAIAAAAASAQNAGASELAHAASAPAPSAITTAATTLCGYSFLEEDE